MNDTLDTNTDTKTWQAQRVFEQRGLNGQEAKVEEIKKAAATLWELVDGISVPPGNREAGRLISVSLTNLEQSVMWAVKALSRNH